MVLRVCRRVLRHEQDAEDAFQATFLVLARSTASIRRRDTVGGWLQGVAYRTALKARRSAARRRHHRVVARSPDRATAADRRSPENLPALHGLWETFGPAGCHGRETVPQRRGRETKRGSGNRIPLAGCTDSPGIGNYRTRARNR
jgi:hypothetical protein